MAEIGHERQEICAVQEPNGPFADGGGRMHDIATAGAWLVCPVVFAEVHQDYHCDHAG